LVNYTANPDHDKPTHHLFTCSKGGLVLHILSLHASRYSLPTNPRLHLVGWLLIACLTQNHFTPTHPTQLLLSWAKWRIWFLKTNFFAKEA